MPPGFNSSPLVYGGIFHQFTLRYSGHLHVSVRKSVSTGCVCSYSKALYVNEIVHPSAGCSKQIRVG